MMKSHIVWIASKVNNMFMYKHVGDVFIHEHITTNRKKQMKQTNKPANIINHIGFVLDASSSMYNKADSLVKVADNLVAHLAQRSNSSNLNQETRISVWTFADPHLINCVVWDMDVLRLPSISSFYKPSGNTALIDATLKSIDDLSETPERYGDHSFLIYVMTDGEENRSLSHSSELAKRIATLPNHWTLAALVPDASGKHEAKRFGFPPGNIEIWNTTSSAGVAEVGERIRLATDTYMIDRALGIRSTRTLFSTDSQTVNAKTIANAGLTPLARNKYNLIPVPLDAPIREFTEEKCGLKYILGRGYYELSKTETIQPQKEIAIVERGPRGRVFIGHDARQMIGLPDMEVRVKPDYNPDYLVYVQSTSVNRKLKAGTKYLYLI